MCLHIYPNVSPPLSINYAAYKRFLQLFLSYFLPFKIIAWNSVTCFCDVPKIAENVATARNLKNFSLCSVHRNEGL